MLVDELAKHRDAILERWFEDVIDGYPDETGKFLKEQSDPFANPVGAGLHQGLSEILDGLVNASDAAELESSLDLVVRVRAVQEFTAAEAVDFVFRLKSIICETLGNRRHAESEEWAGIDHSIISL